MQTRGGLGLMVALAVAACHGGAARGAGVRSMVRPLSACSPAKRASPVHAAETLSVRPSLAASREAWVAASRVIPGGFAGLDRDPLTRRWIIRLVDSSQAAAARGAIDTLLERTAPLSVREVSRAQLDSAQVVPARWSVAELFDWQVYLTLTVPAVREGRIVVRAIGMDEGRNLVLIGVSDVASRQFVEATLAPLDIPCHLVGLEMWPEATLTSTRHD